nr:AbiH family protein [Enterococcus faecalis]
MLILDKKVIILGNGFDLACGLKSRYSDFFLKRIPENFRSILNIGFNYFKKEMFSKVGYKTIFNVMDPKSNIFIEINCANREIYEELENSELTFWDLVFYCFDDDNNDLQWQQVEQKMLEFLNTPKELVDDIPSLNKILMLFDADSLIKANVKILFCLHLASYLPRDKKDYDKEELMNYLHKELRLFEKSFSAYIKSVESEEYKRKACELLSDITNSSSVYEMEDVVFSFNYTNPFNVYNPKIFVVNVNGTVEDDNIIFGIDQERIDPKLDIFRFTKTFRQMTETKLATKYDQEILPSKDEVTEIAFYGHSLSNLDYSYFQTIFDYYDLYGSKIVLVFYYKVYKGTTKEDMELDLADKISKLLYSYSESIDNIKRGKNLMHKLLLEKRLFIKEIASE